MATHGVFVGGADTVLASDVLDMTIVTNSIPPFRITSEEAQEKLSVLDCTKLFADSIQLIHSST